MTLWASIIIIITTRCALVFETIGLKRAIRIFNAALNATAIQAHEIAGAIAIGAATLNTAVVFTDVTKIALLILQTLYAGVGHRITNFVVPACVWVFRTIKSAFIINTKLIVIAVICIHTNNASAIGA